MNKRLEQLRKEYDNEDNDIKAFGIGGKIIREERKDRFEDVWLEKIKARYPTELRANGSYAITTDTHGIIDYWPLANKLNIRKGNRWIKPGLRWMINNIMN